MDAVVTITIACALWSTHPLQAEIDSPRLKKNIFKEFGWPTVVEPGSQMLGGLLAGFQPNLPVAITWARQGMSRYDLYVDKLSERIPWFKRCPGLDD